jgi:hypothetical protein
MIALGDPETIFIESDLDPVFLTPKGKKIYSK